MRRTHAREGIFASTRGRMTKVLTPWCAVIMMVALCLIATMGCSPSDTTTSDSGMYEHKDVRESQYAGSWYPGNAGTLTNRLDNYIQPDPEKDTRAIIVPHAGWRYSGETAAKAYAKVEHFDTAILIAPSHRASFAGASVPNATHYETPLGEIPIAKRAQDLGFRHVEGAHKKEHAIEVQLPFIQHINPNASIIPLVIGPHTTKNEMEDIADKIRGVMDRKTLIVISSDFTHYGPRYGYTPFSENVSENIRELDMGAVRKIEQTDTEGFRSYCARTGTTICGKTPITIMLKALSKEECNGELISYTTSGEMSGDYSNSVSYAAMGIHCNQSYLSQHEKELLLNTARGTLDTYIINGSKPKSDTGLTETLEKKHGCFTTLRKNGELRGCIGHIMPKESLYECVRDNVVSAAVSDKRFPKVTSDELDDITIEVSVLTVPKEVSFSSGSDLLTKIRPGVDGVVLKQGFRQSTYLPQVWEKFSSKERFLSRLCSKGGMSDDCWKQSRTTVLTYQAHVFSESEE